MFSGRNRGWRGALLVEALISFALMFTLGLVVMGLQAQAYQAADKARALNAATVLARDVLEEAVSKPYNQLLLGQTVSDRSVAFLRAGELASTQYQIRTVVESGPIEGIKSVWVEVSWESGRVDVESFSSDS